MSRSIFLCSLALLLMISIAACTNSNTSQSEAESEIEPLSEEEELIVDSTSSQHPDESSREEVSEEQTEAESSQLPEESSGVNSSAAPPVPQPAEESPQSAAESSSQSEPAPAQQPLPQITETIPDPPVPESSDLSQEAVELELFRLINREREANGIPALGMEESMHWAARMRAPEVLRSLSHTRTDGTPYYTAFDEAGFSYAGKWHGENVSTMYFPAGSYGSQEAAEKMFNNLKASAGHYQNMLSQNFHQAGIGVYIERDGDTVHIASAQLFASL